LANCFKELSAKLVLYWDNLYSCFGRTSWQRKKQVERELQRLEKLKEALQEDEEDVEFEEESDNLFRELEDILCSDELAEALAKLENGDHPED
jgi:DNA-binding transcriptional regulator GbsR (MarR family)